MSARLEVLTGARTGLVFPLSSDVVTIGRGSECHLRLDPDQDLHVSGRHVALRRDGDGWTAEDLGSLNGTRLNDVALAAPTALGDGDRIALGDGGPVLVFRTAAADALAPRRLTLAVTLGGVALAVGLGAFLYADGTARRSWSAERGRMQQRLDSLQREGERTQAALRGQVSGLGAALQASRGDVQRLRQDLEHAGTGGDPERTARLRERLQAAGAVLRRQQLAAGLDFAAIEKANRHAVATIYVEDVDGGVSTATAFAVRPDGVLLTNRHVVKGVDGRHQPRRIAIQFTDSEQIWPARLLATSETADVAAVAVDNILGRVPVIHGFNLRADTLAADAPVAMIGFPMGGQTPQLADGEKHMVEPILGAGSLRSAGGQVLQVRGYGAAGASGTPIFDESGDVVGVLFGGRQEEAGQMLYAVPAAAAARLLAELPPVSSR